MNREDIEQAIYERTRRFVSEDVQDAILELIAAEREAIKDEWWMCVQSDLEHGVKSLNENAAKDFNKNYPEIAKFGAWLEARGNT